MRGHCYVVAVLALTAATAPCLAEKVTTDPNAGGTKPAASAQGDIDQRMAKPATYEGGYKRLHYAIEELAAQTGVKIRCGANNQDWQVRDLPMAFAAHEIPLGKLLEAIASAANLELIAKSVKGDRGETEKEYRLSLTSRSRTALDSYLALKHQASVDREDQMWDALVANADIPDSDFTANGASARMARGLGKILKELGSDAKAKALAGQKTDLSVHDFAKPDLLRDFLRAASERYPTAFEGHTLSDGDIDASMLGIHPYDDPATGTFGISIVPPLRSGNMVFAPSIELDTAASQVWQSTTGHEPPKCLSAKMPDEKLPDHLSKDLIPLDVTAGAKTSPEFMGTKVTLDLPKDRDVTYGEVIAKLAKAAGLTIIAEDYLDHKRKSNMMVRSPLAGGGMINTTGQIVISKGTAPPGKIADMLASAGVRPNTPFSPISALGKDTTVGEVLRALAKVNSGAPRFEWFCDEKAKLLVARPPDWIKKHNNLMPESVLLNLKKKADGNGIELDDLVGLMAYSTGQLNDWVWQSEELGFISNTRPSPPSDSVWGFYEKLTPEDKALARSEAGLPLAKLDTEWVAGFVKAGIDSDNTIRVIGGSDESIRNQKEQTAKQTRLLTDSDAVRALTLKIVKEPAHKFSSVGSGVVMMSASDSGDWHTYRPQLQGKYKGENIDVPLELLYPSFPIYSPERDAELAAKKKGADR